MEVLKKTGAWWCLDQSASLLITDERQLDIIIEDINKPMIVEDERGVSLETRALYETADSLVEKVSKAKESGAERLEVSYDFFFGGSKRQNYPDSDKTIKAFKIIHDVAKEYGLGFSASILNPLDIGGEYVKSHDETGFSCQYREGEIKPDGSYDVELDFQQQWTNNKGPIKLIMKKIIVYAFNEQRVGDSVYYYVDPDKIEDISSTVEYEISDEIEYSTRGYGRSKMRLYGKAEAGKHTRCLAVAVYRTQEIDYFADGALDYMKSIIDKHRDAGITYTGFYSDEMHIQFDWDLGVHFGLEEITARYITKNFSRIYAEKYGEQFSDFTKYLVYFTYHQHTFLDGEESELPAQHVFGNNDEGIYATWLFRKRYFELLNDKVVGLAIEAKEYAESLFGAPIVCRGHATWEESPALDRNYPEARFSLIHDEKYSRYDYHPDYDFSSSIIEAMAGCYDYFRWNDFFTGGGTDHGEDGYSDRNYYAQAFGASLAKLNSFDFGYTAAWGSPNEVLRRFNNVGKTYGTCSSRNDVGDCVVQGLEGRISDVLAIYPLDLVYVEERFGSWMVQYGYCNYITERKLLELATVTSDGKLRVKNDSYRALVVMFSPFTSKRTLKLISDFLASGGKVLWMGPPPIMDWEDSEQVSHWTSLFGADIAVAVHSPIKAAGKRIIFSKETGIEDMDILTDMLPDFVYPAIPDGTGKAIASLGEHNVAVMKSYPNGGCAVYAGFRVRDDQSQSTGKDVSALFSLLKYMGAYSPDGGEIISRPVDSRYIINRYNNGTVSLTNHYRTFYEHWDSLYFREDSEDTGTLLGRELPPVNIDFDNEKLFGHTISYHGTDTLTYRLSETGRLLGFAGNGSCGITVDGQNYRFTENRSRIVWALLPEKYYAEGITCAVAAMMSLPGKLTIPNVLGADNLSCGIAGAEPFAVEDKTAAIVKDGNIDINVDESAVGKWILVFSTTA